jgi:hypothetical protein
MNYGRIVLAGVVATVVFFLYGFLVHGWLIAKDYTPYPQGVYLSGDAARSHMSFGLGGIFLAIMVFATIYAKFYQGGSGLKEGALLGLLFGVFMDGAFVAVNYGTINISSKLALELALSAPLEWTLVGLTVGMIYKPSASATRQKG